MGWQVKTKSLQSIYKDLGIESKGKVKQFLGKTVADNLKKYVSFKSGAQEMSIHSIEGGEKVVIDVPYAQFQAGGKVMVGIKSGRAYALRGEKKVLTRKNLVYHSDRLRGSRPFERMVADKREKILNQVAAYARRIDNE